MEREKAQQLVVRYGPAIFRLAYARTGSREDAEDVTQETFLRLVRRGKDFQEEEHCRAWLLRVAANCATICSGPPENEKSGPWRRRSAFRSSRSRRRAAYWRRCWPCRSCTGCRCTCFTTRGCRWRRRGRNFSRMRDLSGTARAISM